MMNNCNGQSHCNRASLSNVVVFAFALAGEREHDEQNMGSSMLPQAQGFWANRRFPTQQTSNPPGE
jgi:hypothetical protein